MVCCQLCSRILLTDGNLRRHMNTVHKRVTNDDDNVKHRTKNLEIIVNYLYETLIEQKVNDLDDYTSVMQRSELPILKPDNLKQELHAVEVENDKHEQDLLKEKQNEFGWERCNKENKLKKIV